jgi:AcrR family transcriptional regulator
MKRRYQLKERARRQAETRQRIVEAAVDLHTSVGPARTTISGIAERAGVQRHTVYAHFRDDHELFAACSAHWNADNPFPDSAQWDAIDDRERRLRTALDALYEWYEHVESHVALFRRDADSVSPDVRRRDQERLQRVHEGLARSWPRRKTVRAALAHALEFETWRSLVRRQGLSRKQAVDAMLRLVASI